MGWRIVKQPNQLFARFSEIVDHFTHVNLTKEEAVMVCIDEGCSKAEATLKVDAGIRDLRPFSTIAGNGLDRWYHCLGIIEMVHGKEAVEEYKEIGERT